MLDNLFESTIANSISLTSTLTIVLSAVALGVAISLVYIFTHKKEGYSDSFTITLIMLPAIIAMIILLVGNNIASAFSLAGAFSLIRFRSAPGDAKDIGYVFFSLAVGLACGMGYIAYGTLFAVILCALMVILNKIEFGKNKNIPMRLKIVLPEDMDYQGRFDDILEEYTTVYRLQKVKTTEFGSLFELTYDVNLRNEGNIKTFIDKLRCKNGNLNIILSIKENSQISTL